MPETNTGADRVLRGKAKPLTQRQRSNFQSRRNQSILDDLRSERRPEGNAADDVPGLADRLRANLAGGVRPPQGDIISILEGVTGVPIEYDSAEEVAKQERLTASIEAASLLTPEERRQNAEDTITSAQKMSEALIDLESRVLDEASLVAVAELREETALQLSQAENELLQAQQQMRVQDVIFDFQAEEAGLGDELDLAPLEEAITKEGGLGAQTFQAISDLANNAALTAAEKSEGINLLLARQHFSNELTATVHDVVQRQTELESLESRSDLELLGDDATFFNPTIPFDVIGIDDLDRLVNNMSMHLEDFKNQAGGSFPDEDWSWDVYNELFAMAASQNTSDPYFAEQVEKLAQRWQVDPTIIATAFIDAEQQARASEEAWNDALEADSFVPGSEGAIAAIAQAGEEIGIPPEFIDLIAKSTDLHIIIDEMSGGKSGQKGEGNIAGVGGLTLDMYEILMREEWTPQRGLKWELQALLEYIGQQFGGDPMAAVQFFRRTGEWGGTSGVVAPGSQPSD
jgi:hypothetical protein